MNFRDGASASKDMYSLSKWLDREYMVSSTSGMPCVSFSVSFRKIIYGDAWRRKYGIPSHEAREDVGDER